MIRRFDNDSGKTRLTAALVAALTGLCWPPHPSSAAEVINLPPSAEKMTPDGRVVIGNKWSLPESHWIWTRQTGEQPFAPNPGYERTFPADIADDGNTLLVRSESRDAMGFLGVSRPFLWNAESGFFELPVPTERSGYPEFIAEVISGSGSVVVATTNLQPSSLDLDYQEEFRWTKDDGSVVLDGPFGGPWRGKIWDASYDGSVLVGWASEKPRKYAARGQINYQVLPTPL